MNKNYQIWYLGRFAEGHVTRKGAESHAFRLATEKGWDINKIEIKQCDCKGAN